MSQIATFFHTLISKGSFLNDSLTFYFQSKFEYCEYFHEENALKHFIVCIIKFACIYSTGKERFLLIRDNVSEPYKASLFVFRLERNCVNIN